MHVPESELTPESILPEQLRDAPLGGARVQPEKRLQVAVLADAIMAFQRWAGVDGPHARRCFTEVDVWFASDATDGPFTFITICDSLQLDPAYIRCGLRLWRAQAEARAGGRWSLRRDGSGSRHQVVVPRLRRVA